MFNVIEKKLTKIMESIYFGQLRIHMKMQLYLNTGCAKLALLVRMTFQLFILLYLTFLSSANNSSYRNNISSV